MADDAEYIEKKLFDICQWYQIRRDVQLVQLIKQSFDAAIHRAYGVSTAV